MPRSNRTTPRHILATLAAATALVLTACGGDADGSTPVAEAAADEPIADVPFGPVDPAIAAGLAAEPSITVIDVRTPEEYADGHIEGATLIDLSEPTFREQIEQLDRNGTYLVYCRSGNRSGQAASMMRELGFERVYDLQGGVIALEAAGLALVG